MMALPALPSIRLGMAFPDTVSPAAVTIVWSEVVRLTVAVDTAR
jgi:hypothetical protein